MRRLKRLFMWFGCLAFGHHYCFFAETPEGDYRECLMCQKRVKSTNN